MSCAEGVHFRADKTTSIVPTGVGAIEIGLKIPALSIIQKTFSGRSLLFAFLPTRTSAKKKLKNTPKPIERGIKICNNKNMPTGIIQIRIYGYWEEVECL